MPTQIEIRVMDLLNSIETSPTAGSTLTSWGNEAVTVVCDAALGSYVGIRLKMRLMAVDLLGSIDHPQASETVVLLLTDSNVDISVSAMRAAGQQKNPAAVEQLGSQLARRDLSPLLAVEAVKALAAIGDSNARAALQRYIEAPAEDVPHRASPLVADRLKEIVR
jgi:HEAT repeat protein